MRYFNFLIISIYFIYFFLYYQCLFNGYVNWDDKELVFDNYYVKQGNYYNLVFNYFIGNYIPVSMIIYSLMWKLFTNKYIFYHLISIVVHSVNAFLVLKFTEKIFRDNNKFLGLFTFAIFLLHPVQAEVICWIAEMKTLISGFFYFASIIAYLNFSFYPKTNSSKWWYIISVLLALFSALSKPISINIVLILILLDWFHLKNFRLLRWAYYMPYFLIALIAGFLNLDAHITQHYLNEKIELSYLNQFFNVFYLIYLYSKNFLIPFHLSAFYPYPDFNESLMIGIFSIIVLIMTYYYSLSNKNKYLLFSLNFVIIQLLLVLQIIPFGNAIAADRYMYYATIGYAWLLYFLLNKNKFFYKSTIIWILMTLPFTYKRVMVWKDNISLNMSILKEYPQSYAALNFIGGEYLLQNKYDLCIYYLNKSLSINNKYYKTYFNRALYYIHTHQPEKALNDLNYCIYLSNYDKAYLTRGILYFYKKDYNKAIKDIHHFLRTNSNFQAYLVLADIYNEQNKLDSSLYYYKICEKIQPYNFECYLKKSIVLGKLGHFDDAITELNLAIKLNSNCADCYYWRAIAKIQMNNHYKKMIYLPCDDLYQAMQKGNQDAQKVYNTYCGQ